MRYAAKNSVLLQQDYLKQISHSVDELHNKKVRKNTIVALLSHWQTLICSQIQLFDNHVAQRFKCTDLPDLQHVNVDETKESEAEKANKTVPASSKPPQLDSNRLLSDAEAFG